MVALFVIGAETLGRSCERPGVSALKHYNITLSPVFYHVQYYH